MIKNTVQHDQWQCHPPKSIILFEGGRFQVRHPTLVLPQLIQLTLGFFFLFLFWKLLQP